LQQRPQGGSGSRKVFGGDVGLLQHSSACGVGALGELLKHDLTPAGEGQERGACVIGIGCGPQKAGGEEIAGDALHALAGQAKAAGDGGHGARPCADDAEDVPPGSGLAKVFGDRRAGAPGQARQLVHVGHQQPVLLTCRHDNILS
jgi:hypothetical protein